MSRSAEQQLRLHLINALFVEATGQDAYLAGQIKAAIEHSIDASLPPYLQCEQFFRAAEELLTRFFRKRPAHAFSFWNAAPRPHGFQPLLARQELVALFKKLSAHPRATVLIGNLRNGICPPGCRWTSRRRAEYADAVSLIQDLARDASPRNSNLLLLFV